MKRINGLYDEVCSFSNIHEAYLKARKNKRYRQEVLRYTLNLEENIIELQYELENGLYKQGEFREFSIFVPKLRRIKALPFKDRVLQHAVNSIIEPIFDKGFYVHSYACRKGKGTHNASNQLKKWLHNNKNKKLYCLKCDIKKYFDSIDLKVLYLILKRKIKDKKLLWLIRQILELKKKDKGLPIGNLTSQLFANIYLNELDKFIKEELRVKKYIRYMDDFLILTDDKKILHEHLSKIISFLEKKLKLELNDKTRIFPTATGVDFVGYVHFENFIKVRKSTWKREKKTMKRAAQEYKEGLIDYKKLENIYGSILGHLKHADTFNTRMKISEFKLRLVLENEKKQKRHENE